MLFVFLKFRRATEVLKEEDIGALVVQAEVPERAVHNLKAQGSRPLKADEEGERFDAGRRRGHLGHQQTTLLQEERRLEQTQDFFLKA